MIQRSLRVLVTKACEARFDEVQLFGHELLNPAKRGLAGRLGTEIPSHVPTFRRPTRSSVTVTLFSEHIRHALPEQESDGGRPNVG
jgi:hypothetical protein